jgi:hypothetical protein
MVPGSVVSLSRGTIQPRPEKPNKYVPLSPCVFSVPPRIFFRASEDPSAQALLESHYPRGPHTKASVEHNRFLLPK